MWLRSAILARPFLLPTPLVAVVVPAVHSSRLFCRDFDDSNRMIFEKDYEKCKHDTTDSSIFSYSLFNQLGVCGAISSLFYGHDAVGRKIDQERAVDVHKRFPLPSFSYTLPLCPDGEVILRSAPFSPWHVKVAILRTALISFYPPYNIHRFGSRHRHPWRWRRAARGCDV